MTQTMNVGNTIRNALMGSLQRADRVILLIALCVIIAIFGFTAHQDRQVESSFRKGDQAELFTSLRYCSDHLTEECQKGVAEIQVRTLTRAILRQERFNYAPVTQIKVSIEDIELKLVDKVKDTLPGDILLYYDTNNNSVLDDDDEQVAQAKTKKREVKFANIDFVVSDAMVNNKQFNEINTFFVTGRDEPLDLGDVSLVDELGEPYTARIFDDIKVKAFDVTYDERPMKTTAVFADQSLFAYKSEVIMSASEFLEKYPWLKQQSGTIVWPAGTRQIKENMIIPAGLSLRVEPGARIKIAPDTSVVSYSPIQMEANADRPIRIEALEVGMPFNSFAMLGALNNDQDIVVNHVYVSGGSEDHINGAVISGMFSIYRFGKVTVTNSIFEGSVSDDGLNIKNSKIDLRKNTFIRNSADAFDGDFVIGPISNNLFIANGNDSLDFSGSNVDLIENVVLESGDKCASVGEKTTARLRRNAFHDCNIGVEVKDLSDATVTDNVITGSKTSAINMYVKKFFYGEPTISYSNNSFAGNQEYITGLTPQSDDNNVRFDSQKEAEQSKPWYASVRSAAPKP